MINKIPGGDSLPEWIRENVPPELADSSLFRFEVSLVAEGPDKKARKITVDMLPDLDLDIQILEDQMQAIPAQFAFWAAVYSEVRLRASVAERKMKARKGKAVYAIQAELEGKKIKLTAEQIKIVLESDEEVVRADIEFQTAQMQQGKLYHMLEALRMKAELARSLAAFRRQELQNS